MKGDYKKKQEMQCLLMIGRKLPEFASSKIDKGVNLWICPKGIGII